MPLSVDRLSKSSSANQIAEAISMSISKLVKEGRDRQEASAISYNIARKQTGRSLGK